MMKEQIPFLKFITVAFCCYAAWFLIYELWLLPMGLLDFWLTNLITKNAVYCLNAIGYKVYHQVEWSKHYISGPTTKILGIGNPCNGLVLYPIFIGFILASPGKIKNKMLMIVLGSIGVYILNLFRVILLGIIQMESPEYLHFNHKYTFVIIVYGFIFLLWMLWINKYSGVQLKKSYDD